MRLKLRLEPILHYIIVPVVVTDLKDAFRSDSIIEPTANIKKRTIFIFLQVIITLFHSKPHNFSLVFLKDVTQVVQIHQLTDFKNLWLIFLSVIHAMLSRVVIH